jgi:MFS superfamily sulfate permease-like transporter
MVCLIRYVALGFANIFSAITGGYPISGSFSRTALNDEVGATSPISVLVVAILVGIITKIASIAPVSAAHPLIASDHLPN